MVDIVIVNWNTGNFLNECLNSIIKDKSAFINSIVIVDNNSSDNSFDCVKNYKDLQLVKLEKNFGFGKACNIGANKLKSEYILFLNPDTRINKDSIEKVVDFMDLKSSKKFGICGIQLLDDLGLITKSCSRFPSIIGSLFYASGLSKFFPSFGNIMKEWSHDENREVDQVMGAFFFIRSKLFNELNGFDERFFVYYEEVDLTYRSFLKGYKSKFLADTYAYHEGGVSSSNIKAKRIFYSHRSQIQYFFKHFSIWKGFIIISIILFIEFWARVFLSILKFSKKNFIQTIKSYILLLKWIINRK